MKDNSVIVVGGGPVGLLMALELASRSVPVLVLEASPQPISDPRGAAFHPPSLDILNRLGVLCDLLSLGVQVPLWQVRERGGGIVAEFDLGLLASETRWPYRFHLGQQKFVPVLATALARYPNARLLRGAQVTALEQTGDSVTLSYEADGTTRQLTAPYVIGADGAHSIVRKSAGIEFEGYTWPERFVVTNLADDLEALGFARTNYVSDPDRWAVVLKLEDEAGAPNWRVTYPADPALPDAAVLDPADVQSRLRDAIAPGHDFHVRYAGIYRVHQRVAARFRLGRVLLVGDAAHVNNPLGGFGLNSGFHDAANLGEKLARVLDGTAGPDLLDRFERQRRHANLAYVQTASIRNKAMMDERDPAVRARALADLRATASDPDRARAYLLGSSMIASVRAADAVQ